MKVLVLNCGSSSIKYQLYNMKQKEVIAKGMVDKLGMQGSCVDHTKENGQQVKFEGEILDHNIGIEYILGILSSEKHGCLKSIQEIDAVGHRIVNGGERFYKSVLITGEVLNAVEKCIDIAPLHNPANLKGIYAIKNLLPDAPQVGVFDTAFHQTIPDYAYMYAIPYSLYKKYGIRRYGFHGTSHSYVAHRACEVLNVDYNKQKIITCHLGNGASMAAIKNGKSVDTSMGFTPVEGLIMGTRTGDLDIGAIAYIMDKEEIGLPSLNSLFNKSSGMLGISGISSDMREILEEADKGNERAILSLKMYSYRVKKYIGAYTAALNGIDILVFAGGIGENSMKIRTDICSGLDYLGIEIDKSKNNTVAKETLISKKSSKVKVMVVPTNEEFVIANDTMKIVSEIL